MVFEHLVRESSPTSRYIQDIYNDGLNVRIICFTAEQARHFLDAQLPNGYGFQENCGGNLFIPSKLIQVVLTAGQKTLDNEQIEQPWEDAGNVLDEPKRQLPRATKRGIGNRTIREKKRKPVKPS